MAVLLFSGRMCLNAAEEENVVPVSVSDQYEDVLGYAQYYYYYDRQDMPLAVSDCEFSGLLASKAQIILEINTCVDYVDIIGVTGDGRYVNLSDAVEVAAGDEEIASYRNGRIYGVGEGMTELRLRYGSLEVGIPVTVNAYFDFEAMIEAMLSGEGEVSPCSVPGPQMQAVMSRAYEMYSVEWVTKDAFILNDGTKVGKGTTLRGLPYTQKNRCTVREFLFYHDKWETSGFYTFELRDNGCYWCEYGIDCTGLICWAWNLPVNGRNTFGTSKLWDEIKDANSSKFEKVGAYTIPANATLSQSVNQAELYASYGQLNVGDAVVQRRDNGGHARLVLTNIRASEKVSFYEAHGNFPEIVTFSYDQLAYDHYCPFTIKTDFYNQYN